MNKAIKLFAVLGGLFFIFWGAVVCFAGILFCLTIIGALIGIPMFIAGSALIGTGLISIGFSTLKKVK